MVDVRAWTNSPPKNKTVILGVDVGGTNTNVALATTATKPVMLTSFHFATSELKDVDQAIDHVMQYVQEHKLKVKAGCVAVAGPVVKDKSIAINIPFVVDASKLTKKYKVKFKVVNDFEAIAKGIDAMPAKDIISVQKGKPAKKGLQVFMGAGTGLGKSIRVYDEKSKEYTVQVSEGGHADFAFYPNEMDMCKYFALGERCPTEEMMVSGPGVERIYNFLRPMAMGNRMIDEIDQSSEKAKLISKYYKKDKLCKQTLDTFAQFYARSLRNFVLNTLPQGGAFLAGGVAAKNKQIFGKEFLKEFLNADDKLVSILKDIPVYLIANYDVSLYGAVMLA